MPDALRVLVAGSTPFLRLAIQALDELDVAITGVAVSPRVDDRARAWARGHRVFGPDDLASGLPARSEEPEVLVSFLYSRLLPAALLEQVPLALNFHPAPLPEMRGIHVFEHAVLTKATDYRATCHHVSEQFDEGDIVAERQVATRPDDTAGALYRRALRANLELMREVIGSVVASGSLDLPRRPQGPGTWISRRDIVRRGTPTNSDDDEELERKLRAACWDGTSALLCGRRFPVGPAGVAAVRRHLVEMGSGVRALALSTTGSESTERGTT